MGYTCLSSSGGSVVCPPLIHHYLSCSLSLSVNLQISFLEHFCSPFLLSAWNPWGNSHFGVTVSRVWYSDWGTQGLLEGPFMGSLVFSLRIFFYLCSGICNLLPSSFSPSLPPSFLFISCHLSGFSAWVTLVFSYVFGKTHSSLTILEFIDMAFLLVWLGKEVLLSWTLFDGRLFIISSAPVLVTGLLRFSVASFFSLNKVQPSGIWRLSSGCHVCWCITLDNG